MTDTHGGPRPRSLLDLAGRLLALTLSLRRGGDYGEEPALRQRIAAYLGEIEREGAAAGIARDDLDALRYPLVAFIDETILASEWAHREKWRDRPLQLDLYGTRTAGTGFFERLAALRQAGEAKRDLLEVYHLCLLLGFEGQYRVTGRERLRLVLEELQGQLGYSARRAKEPRLSPHGRRREEGPVAAGDGFPTRRVALFAAAVLVVLFLVFFIAINHGADQALELIPPPSY